MRIALCIEGGGMRGAVSAGMCAAIKYCGLEEVFDVVYGCSAGAIVGAYFVSRQLPVYGAQIYFDVLCGPMGDAEDEEDEGGAAAGVGGDGGGEGGGGEGRGRRGLAGAAAARGRFIDLLALRHHPYLRRLRGDRAKTFYSRSTRPVLHLDALLDAVVRERRPLDWRKFWDNHQRQPLRPVAASLRHLRSEVLQFSTLDGLLDCLRASARVPGIAGDPVTVGGETYCDGLMFEPVPFRSAIADGATHVLVLRTKPDAALDKIPTKPGVYEKHIAAPYFNMQESPAVAAAAYVSAGGHFDVYRRDTAELVAQNAAPDTAPGAPAVCSVVPPSSVPEVGQLEARPGAVYDGVRTGFAAAYEMLSPFATSPADVAAGAPLAGDRVARMVFSDRAIDAVIREKKADRRLRSLIRRARRRRVRRDARGDMSVEERFFVQ